MPRLLLLTPALLAGLIGVRAADPPAPSGPAIDLKFASVAESKAEFDRAVGPVLAKHCNGCHNGKKDEGDLDLTALDPDMKATTSGARWAIDRKSVV